MVVGREEVGTDNGETRKRVGSNRKGRGGDRRHLTAQRSSGPVRTAATSCVDGLRRRREGEERGRRPSRRGGHRQKAERGTGGGRGVAGKSLWAGTNEVTGGRPVSIPDAAAFLIGDLLPSALDWLVEQTGTREEAVRRRRLVHALASSVLNARLLHTPCTHSPGRTAQRASLICPDPATSMDGEQEDCTASSRS